ncbi:MAG: Ppx/GppA family phosphatase [Paracoccaceae bacterium]
MTLQKTAEQQDADLFLPPLFANPSSRALSRVGVVDVGSNSVRLVVFDGAARSPAYFYNEKIMCGLGAGLADTGRLNPEGRVRALSAIRRFQAIAEGMDLPPLSAVATAAVRDAKDGPSFCAEVLDQTGMTLHVISGDEEARLSAQGVLLGWPGSYGLVCDIGGASMELAEISDGKVGKRVTSPLGPLKLRDVKGGKKGRHAHIKSTIADMREALGPQRNRLFLVGGSWRAIAKLDMVRRGYPLRVLHEYRMTSKSVSETAKFIASHSLEELKSMSGVSMTRMALVPYAIEVLKRLVRTFRPHDIAVSSYGIREGLLYEQMPQPLRERDPLIEACFFAEDKDARQPGFGAQLYTFVRPLFARCPPERRRIIKAACLLHDVSWRAHPDYRAEVCFDNATRANLGGLTHQERVYLGLALMHRYRNKRDGTSFDQMIDLLHPDDQRQAEILGKAMRFGAMMWTQENAQPGELSWAPRRRLLQLRLTSASVPLFGEVAEARLNSLASSLDAELKVILPRKR